MARGAKGLAVSVLVIALAILAIAPAAQASGKKPLRAGVGRADITPKLGYYLGGWTRQDRTAQGQHTRLFASALVLQRGGTKVGLVSLDLFMVPGGMVQHVAQALAARGFSEQNLVINASHTHSGPGGYGNSPTLNFAAPSLQTAVDPLTFLALAQQPPADRQLYTFLVNQIAAAVRRADKDRARAALGWGSARLPGVTRNRSLEAHLANHGVIKARGNGRPEDDPDGAEHTIDTRVDMLRVDKLVRGRRVPIGGWSMFPDHGTVTKSTFEYYNQDHHASALRVFEAKVRRSGKVPSRQAVLNVYGNGNEGDMSAGLDRTGPAGSDEVGRLEAGAMLQAWRRAGKGGLARRPALDLRWTRVCFCGQMTETGPVASAPEPGLPFFTGSEEERGPLYDVTGQHFEDRRDPLGSTDQGHKIGIPGAGASLPRVVPLVDVRVKDKLIAGLPGEPTSEIGRRLRSRILQATRGSGVRDVVVSGLTNEFILYITTYDEYERQHYEGGNTHYGPSEGTFLIAEHAKLAGALVGGTPAPAPHPFDPTFGVVPNGAPYPDGAGTGQILDQPGAAYARLDHPGLVWRGGAEGLDRPVDRAFVTAQRKVKRQSQGRSRSRWLTADSDLGLAMLWTVDANGLHRAHWEVPLDAKPGVYRFVVTAKRYRLVSRSFRVHPRPLPLTAVRAGPGQVAVQLGYPTAVRDRDLTFRPPLARGGKVRFRIGRRTVTVRRKRASIFRVRAPSGTTVAIRQGAARDRFGNRNGNPLTLVAP